MHCVLSLSSRDTLQVYRRHMREREREREERILYINTREQEEPLHTARSVFYFTSLFISPTFATSHLWRHKASVLHIRNSWITLFSMCSMFSLSPLCLWVRVSHSHTQLYCTWLMHTRHLRQLPHCKWPQHHSLFALPLSLHFLFLCKKQRHEYTVEWDHCGHSSPPLPLLTVHCVRFCMWRGHRARSFSLCHRAYFSSLSPSLFISLYLVPSLHWGGRSFTLHLSALACTLWLK